MVSVSKGGRIMLKIFRCANCDTQLYEITKLSDEAWWYECSKCRCQASHWGPYWEKRFDLTHVMVGQNNGN